MTVIAAATPHVAALITRLRAQFPVQVVVYDAEVPDDPGQAYAVVWSAPGYRDRTAMGVTPDWWSADIQVTCVGVSARNALDVADLTASALAGFVLTVAGRLCNPITQVDLEQPVQRDDTLRDPATNRSRFYLPTQWRLSSCATT